MTHPLAEASGKPEDPIEVLIVEDEVLIAKEIERRLISLGHKVAGMAKSGEEAIAMSATKGPTLVLMDIKLKGELDGVEAAGRIRSQLDIPIIYLTSYADAETLQRAKATDPFGYIVKPLTDSSLPVSIEMALAKHDLQQRLRATGAWFFSALRAISDGIIGVNADDEIWFMNPAAESLLSCQEEAALGKPVNEVVSLADEKTSFPPEVLNNMSKISEGLWSTGILLSHNGRRIPVETHRSPIMAGEAFLGSMLVFRDLSARQLMPAAAG